MAQDTRLTTWKRRGIKINFEGYRLLHIAQGGTCAICRRAETKEDRRNLSVDHDHGTGQVRGLLCNDCNRMLGSAGDDPGRLMAAVEYLRGQRPVLPPSATDQGRRPSV